MATVDTLEIQIQTSAESTSVAIDKLVQRLGIVEKSLKSVGNASNSGFDNMKRMSSSFSTFNSMTNKSNVSISTLANSLSRVYLRVQTLKKGFSALSDSLNNSIGYFENLNYFTKAFEQVAQKADYSSFEEMGYASAEEYAASFMKRANQLTAKMTGFSINTDGMLEDTGGVSLGLNPSDLITQQATFSQMASSMGTTSEQALKLSNVLTMLGADLASVKNMDFDKVWTDMQSGLAGMSRTMDKYGANIRLVNLQLLLNKLGIEQTVSALNQNEKALLRTIAILDATRYSWGDLSETLNQPANQIRVLTANFENLGRMIGNLFVPMISKALPYINGLVIALQRLVTSAGKFLGIDLSGITSSVGNVDISGILGTDEAEDGVNNVTNAVKKLKSTTLGIDELNINAPQEDTGKTTGGVGIGAVDSEKLNDAFNSIADEYTKAWNNAFEQMENRSQQIADKIAGLFRPFTDIILDDLNNIQWENISKNLIDFSTAIAPYAENFGQGLLNFFEDMGDISVDAINGLFGENGAITNITEWLNNNDPKKAEKWGYAFGVLTTGLVGLGALKSILTPLGKLLSIAKGSSAITSLGNSLKSLGGLSGLLTTDLAVIFGAGTATEIGLTIGSGVVLGIIAAITGFDFGKKIAAGFANTDAEFQEIMNFSWFGEDGFFTKAFTDGKSAKDAFLKMFDYRENWFVAILSRLFLGPIVTIVADVMLVWEEFIGWWHESGAGYWFHENVVPWFTKEKWLETITGIKESISEKWTEFTDWWNSNGVSKWFNEKVKPWFTKETWETAIFGIKTAFSNTFKGVANVVIGWLNKIISGIETLVNNFVGGLSTLTDNIPDVFGAEFEISVSQFTLPRIPTYEVGGYPKSASLFWANENGVPELVGNIGNQTAVASGTEITGISTAIYDTAQEEIALLREQNNLLMELLRKDMSVNIGDREIARANARGQRSLGYALIT